MERIIEHTVSKVRGTWRLVSEEGHLVVGAIMVIAVALSMAYVFPGA